MHQWDESQKTGGAVDKSWSTSTATGQAISRIHHNEQVSASILQILVCSWDYCVLDVVLEEECFKETQSCWFCL